MSRRTKLAIAAVFLVLISIGGGYLALTVTVKEPLRFRLIGRSESRTVAGLLGSMQEKSYEIEAWNAGPFPVLLYWVTLTSAEAPASSEGWFEADGYPATRAGGPGYQGMVLDAGSKVRFKCYVSESAPDQLIGQQEVEYSWMPLVHFQAEQWLEKVPSFSSEYIPSFNTSSTKTPLEPPAEHTVISAP